MMRRLLMVAALLGGACGDDDSGTPPIDSSVDTAMAQDMAIDTNVADAADEMATEIDMSVDEGAPDLPPPPLCEGTAATCIDEQIIRLTLRENITDGEIVNTAADDGFTYVVDSTGGGFMPSESYVYARFTDTGLEKVELNDLDALESTEWDIAFRRFIIRLNSGVSGPSCVEGGRTAGDTDFDTLAEVPDGIPFRAEGYFADDCSFVSDGSGFGSPGVALASFWDYPGCVRMTGNVFIVSLTDGRFVKLRVDTYYSEAQQANCDGAGALGDGSSGSGNVTLRWAYL
ncbi:MAG: HmuY family protein [Myxococcota bacterium]